MERIIKQELVTHLEHDKLISVSQHGFIRHKSCLSNLLEYFQNATNILDSGESVDVVYLDFQKAFDKVLHERLLSKLRAHEVGGSVFAWIRKS